MSFFVPKRIVPPNVAGPLEELPDGFLRFLKPLHAEFSSWQTALIERRIDRLSAAHRGELPDYLPESAVTRGDWKIQLPAWCADQRNQMTGPLDDAELCVKMLNSGSPGVMLDLEDSVANRWENLILGHRNAVSALAGTLTYPDAKRGGRVVGIDHGKAAKPVIWTRVRGLHLSEYGVFDEPVSASLFDVALHAYAICSANIEGRLRHPLCFYIPKSESSEEAKWWAAVFAAVADRLDWPRAGAIYAMALVESHPLCYEMEEFIYHLRDHLLGLDLGRWDLMASIAHYLFEDPRWALPDRNTIPHDVPFFQRVRELLVETCHRRGILAEGGMTALYPSRQDPELNARALAVLEKDKRNESVLGMDGAWTGHPDQNAIAVAQFPSPNQLHRRYSDLSPHPDLRPVPSGVGKTSLAGTRAAIRTAIRYRNGVLHGKGASLLDGYMEDLATDRICRLLIAQRMRHPVAVFDERSRSVLHMPHLVRKLFDEELTRLVAELPKESGTAEELCLWRAAGDTQQMVFEREFDPV